MRAGQLLCDQFAHVKLQVTDSPNRLAHAVLALGPATEVLDHGEANSAHSVLLSVGAVESTPAGPMFRWSRSGGRYQQHPAQFVAYLLSAGVALGTSSESTAIDELLRSEQRVSHVQMDVAWLVVALCLTGRFSEFSNQYGETLTFDSIVTRLLEESAQPLLLQACAGGHNIRAMAVVKSCADAPLSSRNRARLERSWSRAVSRFLNSVCDDGQVDLVAYLASTNAPTESMDVYVHVVGHIVEAIPADDPLVVKDRRYHIAVKWVIDLAAARDLPQLCSAEADGSVDDRRYAAMAHLVHGVSTYVQTAISRSQPDPQSR